ncbi:hypothetical protein IFM89_027368 [Coptis chinensis]|uniref:DUF4378 domain-containing protein n=1 Tax=Coptis chinensis TaxID=261450 RepID=A0A835IG65_9MAGN|nr:hypothetical protein IFM89_027368 [Coptis chinensis]
MGRDWYWGGKSSSSSISSSNSISISSSSSTTKKDEMRETPGCMSGVLHLFDFNQFQFPISQPPCFKAPNSILQEDPTFIKGAEAPRNSLERDEGRIMESSLMSKELNEDFQIPMEIRVLATNAMGKGAVRVLQTRTDEFSASSESSSSPGPKTPNLVARLMGLDLLPDSLSPSPSSLTPSKLYHPNEGRQERHDVTPSKQSHSKFDNQHKKNRSNYIVENEIKYETTGSRSLPDTPRISSARRSDVDPRFSLQLNKENMMHTEEFDYFSRISRDQKSRKRELKNEVENRSPGHYARQIVKQVKESVSRRVGLDITNTSNNRLKSKEVEVPMLKSKKPKRLSNIGDESNSNKHSTSSYSSRLRLHEERKGEAVLLAHDHVSISPRPLSKPRALPPEQPPRPSPNSLNSNGLKPKFSAKPKSKSQPVPQHQTIEKCKKASCERFSQRKEAHIVRGSKPHLTISDKKCNNMTQLPKEITTITTQCSTSTPLPESQNQQSKQSSRLSSCSSRTWCVTPPLNDRDDIVLLTNFADEIRYVSDILTCTGIKKGTLVSFTRWYSPSHPLDPSLFHHLENSLDFSIGSSLKQRCNRKLVFNLIDEMLVNFIKPYLNIKPWLGCLAGDDHFLRKELRGDGLLQILCSEMKKFPSTSCETLEDIDRLIDKDLPDAKKCTLPIFEESESIVMEVGQDILDSLVHEMVADVMQKRRHKTPHGTSRDEMLSPVWDRKSLRYEPLDEIIKMLNG